MHIVMKPTYDDFVQEGSKSCLALALVEEKTLRISTLRPRALAEDVVVDNVGQLVETYLKQVELHEKWEGFDDAARRVPQRHRDAALERNICKSLEHAPIRRSVAFDERIARCCGEHCGGCQQPEYGGCQQRERQCRASDGLHFIA